jgi:hypothetical protein
MLAGAGQLELLCGCGSGAATLRVAVMAARIIFMFITNIPV